METNFNYQDRFTDMNLKQLALEFLDLHNFMFKENFQTSGLSGKNHDLDFMIVGQKNHLDVPSSTGIILRDYKKSLGSDGICQAERLLKDCPDIKKVVVMANEFSVPARNLAERCGVPTISRGELISMLLRPKTG